MTAEQRIPIVEEQVFIDKRSVETDRVRVRTDVVHDQVTLLDSLVRERIEVRHVPVGREVTEMPVVREEQDLTIIPVVEERAVIEKRLFLVEEIHLVRTRVAEDVAIPAEVRRTVVTVERADPEQSPEESN